MKDPELEIIPGSDSDVARNLTRLTDINQNIANVRKEFIGKPKVCHSIATQIIWLRRKPSEYDHREQFWTLLNKYRSTLLEHLDIRWLLSICDTIVDIGDHVQSATAMNIVQCINRCNLDATLLLNCRDGTLDRVQLGKDRKIPTWGGMVTADVPTGDMIYNMQKRLDTVVQRDPLLWDIWCEIKDRSRYENNVVMNFVCAQSKHAHQRKFFL